MHTVMIALLLAASPQTGTTAAKPKAAGATARPDREAQAASQLEKANLDYQDAMVNSAGVDYSAGSFTALLKQLDAIAPKTKAGRQAQALARAIRQKRTEEAAQFRKPSPATCLMLFKRNVALQKLRRRQPPRDGEPTAPTATEVLRRKTLEACNSQAVSRSAEGQK